MIRPVHCYFCGEQMTYRGDENYLPEVKVRVEDGDERVTFYAHADCWNASINAKKNPP